MESKSDEVEAIFEEVFNMRFLPYLILIGFNISGYRQFAVFTVQSAGSFFWNRSCLTRHPTSQTNQSTAPRFNPSNQMKINPLPLDIWYEIIVLLDIKEAIALSKALPQFFGAFVESEKAIRFHNAINSYMHSTMVDLPVGSLTSCIRFVLRDSPFEFSRLISWLGRRLSPILSSNIGVNSKLFEDISSIIASKDRGFVCDSSSLSSWSVEMTGEDDTTCTISWILLYRASLSGYRASDFHQACDGMGKCVVKTEENGKIAAAYNEDGFSSIEGFTPNLMGFIASVDEDGGFREIFHSYGGTALFRQKFIRVSDYQVFKIVIE
jgi:hypothetical protein